LLAMFPLLRRFCSMLLRFKWVVSAVSEVAQLRMVFESAEAKQREREWLHHQQVSLLSRILTRASVSMQAPTHGCTQCEKPAQGTTVHRELRGHVITHSTGLIRFIRLSPPPRHLLRLVQAGELDDGKLVDGVTGERLIYKKRGLRTPKLGMQQVKPKRLMFVCDVSGSMSPPPPPPRTHSHTEHKLSHLVRASVSVSRVERWGKLVGRGRARQGAMG
jgi:hypothetical protein